MIILLTNDDGIYSKKIKYTKEVLQKFGTVYTVAPSIQMSAKAMSLTIGGFHFKKIDEFNYAIDGTPVDCINFALGGLKIKPDLVVSGTNNGYNVGIDTKYSGTVGAALQAQFLGFKSIALSADRLGDSILEQELEKTIKYVLDNDLISSKFTLNINFPREKFGESKGVRDTFVHFQQFDYKPVIDGNKYMPNRQFVMGQELPCGSDSLAFKEGYTSISKITL